MTLYELFYATCMSYPNQVAFEDARRTVTYARMLVDIEKEAQAMVDRGVEAGDRVAVSAGRPYPVLVLELACARLGATLVFLESFMAPNSEEWADAIEGSSAHWAVTWLDETCGGWTRTDEPRDPLTAWPRYILLQARTSGTTGRSKGVCLSETALLLAVQNTRHIAHVQSDSRGMLIYEPLGLLSQIAAFSTLLSGATLVDGMHVADAPDTLAAFLEHQRISHLVMVPQHIAATIGDPQLARRDLSALKTIMYGAAPVTAALMQRARAAIDCRWLQCYGMTETTGPVCWLAHEEQNLAGYSVGRPAPGCDIRIFDTETGEPCEANVTGEVMIRGPLVMEGYWNESTRRPEPGDALTEGWLHTGDLGALSDDGYLLLRGRASDEIVCALGYTIRPRDIESVLENVSGIHETAAIGFELDEAGIVPVVVCHVDPAHAEVSALIRGAFHARLDRSKHPTHFALLAEALPRGSNGKVHKARLRSQLQATDLIAL